jgi:glycosyltransferase involved in cell wall biosynthesis
MSKTPFISIVIPTYKGENYLEVCLRSAVQLVQDIDHEIIVVDNDYYSGEVEKIIKLVEEISKANLLHICGDLLECTAESSMRKGLCLASGEYMWFLGNDDYVTADKNSFLTALKGWPDVILVGNNKDDLRILRNFQKFLPVPIFTYLVIFKLNSGMGHVPRFIFRRKYLMGSDFSQKYGNLGFMNLAIETLLYAARIQVWTGEKIKLDNAPSYMNDGLYFKVFVQDLAIQCRKSISLFFGMIFANRASRYVNQRPNGLMENIINFNYWVKNRLKKWVKK